MLGQSEVMSLHKKENYDVPSFLGLRVPFRDVVDTVSLNNSGDICDGALKQELGFLWFKSKRLH